jgi:hypothetical protein
MTQSRVLLQRTLEFVVAFAMPFLFIYVGPSFLLDQRRMDLKTFDSIFLMISVLFTTLAVLGFNRSGVIAGTLSLWLSWWLEDDILSAYDKDRSGLLDSIWILFGWIFCYTYCVIIYFFKFGILTLLKMVQNAKR